MLFFLNYVIMVACHVRHGYMLDMNIDGLVLGTEPEKSYKRRLPRY